LAVPDRVSPLRVHRGQAVGVGVGVVFDHAAGGHGPEPLAHVALVQLGGVGDLLAGRRRQRGHGVEEPRAVAGGDHQQHGGAIHPVAEAVGKSRAGRRLGLFHKSGAHRVTSSLFL
jgi:hypothetical protein